MKNLRPRSLSFLVKQEEREWVSKNLFRKNLAYFWYERALVHCGQHPLLYSLLLCYAHAAAIFVGWLVPEKYFQGRWLTWGGGEQLSYFTALWGIQATLAAMVYPFVIAFVTLLIQNRPAAKSILQVYLLDSAAVVAGLSSLFLLISMGVQYFLLSVYELKVVVSWVAFDTLWFIFNVVLTAWFLYRTVEFLRPDFEFEVIRRYLVNFALPTHIQNNLRFQFFAHAQSNGWLPEFHSSRTAEKSPHVRIEPYDLAKGTSVVVRQLSVEKRLVDVRLWLLRRVLANWLEMATQHSRDVSNAENEAEQNSSVMVFPLIAGATYEGNTIICRVSGGPFPTRWQRWLIGRAFIFRSRRDERRYLTPTDLLQEASSVTRQAIINRNVPAFEEAHKRLLQMHESAIAACNVVDDKAGKWSYALIPDVLEAFERPIHIYWANVYRDLFKASVSEHAVEVEPFRRLCYLVNNLSSTEFRSAPSEIKTHLLRLPPFLMHLMGIWWIRRAEEQGFQEHDHATPVTLALPDRGTYEDMCREFVGAWENAKVLIRLKKEQHGSASWPALQDACAVFTQHIEETAIMLLEATLRGDQVAAEWLADVLVKWWDNSYLTEYGSFLLYDESDYLTVDLFSFTWDEAEALLHRQPVEFGPTHAQETAALQRAIFSDAIRNFRKDIWILIVEVMLTWAGQAGGRNSLTAHLISGFLEDKKWRGGGRHTESLAQMSSSDLLTALFRQCGCNRGYGSGYTDRLDRFVERAIALAEERWVSGRIYSHSGSNDVRSLVEAQVSLLALVANGGWTPSSTLYRQFSNWSVTNPRSIRDLMDQADYWSSHLSRLDATTSPTRTVMTAAQEILSQLGRGHSTADGSIWTHSAINEARTYLERIQRLALASAPIDKARLEKFAACASSKGFSKESGKFPLGLFQEISETRELLTSFTLTHLINRGEITEDDLAARPVNSGDMYTTTVAEYVAHLVMRDVTSQCAKRIVEARSPAAYWDALTRESDRFRKNGLTPVLILDNRVRPAWVWDWMHPRTNARQQPADLVITRKANQGDGYVAHFNDVLVYVGPIADGASLLIPKEVFHSVQFTKYESGKWVNVEADAIPGDIEKVNIKLTFCRHIVTKSAEIVELVY